ncbi:hypothetical protein ECG_02255 [Echinococcus granulosus]|nr:hypothetical protein ECG_02255 [Echinococcus granulosus]
MGWNALAPSASTVSAASAAAATAHVCLVYSSPCDLILALPLDLVSPLATACRTLWGFPAVLPPIIVPRPMARLPFSLLTIKPFFLVLVYVEAAATVHQCIWY